jgi:hypothetical protein
MSKKFYRDGDKYVAVTGGCPDGFKNVLFNAIVGDTPGSLIETVLQPGTIKSLKPVKASTVPRRWMKAFEAIKPERSRTQPQEVRLKLDFKPGQNVQRLFHAWMWLTGVLYVIFNLCSHL